MRVNLVAPRVVWLLGALLGGGLGVAPAAAESVPVRWEFVLGPPARWVTPNGKSSAPPPLGELGSPELVGVVTSPKGRDYALIRARPCASCKESPRLTIVPAPFEGQSVGKATHWGLPGRVFGTKERAMVGESRVFFGQCLAGRAEGVVTFQREKVDRRRGLQTSVLVGEAGEAYFSEEMLERRLPRLSDVLAAVKRGRCRELAAAPRTTPSRVTDLVPKLFSASADDKEDDEAEDAEAEGANGAPKTPPKAEI